MLSYVQVDDMTISTKVKTQKHRFEQFALFKTHFSGKSFLEGVLSL